MVLEYNLVHSISNGDKILRQFASLVEIWGNFSSGAGAPPGLWYRCVFRQTKNIRIGFLPDFPLVHDTHKDQLMLQIFQVCPSIKMCQDSWSKGKRSFESNGLIFDWAVERFLKKLQLTLSRFVRILSSYSWHSLIWFPRGIEFSWAYRIIERRFWVSCWRWLLSNKGAYL